jgi:hypothetical protein
VVVADLVDGRAVALPVLGHAMPVVAIAPDGRTVAVASGQVVDFVDVDALQWSARDIVHHETPELQAVSADRSRALSADFRGLRVLWRRGGDPVVLPDPVWPQTIPKGWANLSVPATVPHSAAFSPDGRRLITTFNGGIVAMHDGRTGEVAWQGSTDLEEMEGPYTRFDVVPSNRHFVFCGVGEKRVMARPVFTPDGRRVITAGSAEGQSLLMVWDAAAGTVQHRFLFDDTADPMGFLPDGRLRVLAGDTLFALHVGEGDWDTEVIASGVVDAWLQDGELVWSSEASPPKAMRRMTRPQPDPLQPTLERGRVVFP